MFDADVMDTDEEDWAISKGAYLDLVCIAGDESVFAGLWERVLAPTDVDFDDLVAMLAIVVFELVGKVRNALDRGNEEALPPLAVEVAHKTALLLGVHHRNCYTTGTSVLAEALELPSCPGGFEGLVRIIQQGRLDHGPETAAAIEALWRGLVVWMAFEEIDLGARIGWPLDFLRYDDLAGF